MASRISRRGPSLKSYAKKLQGLPRRLAIKVAERGAGKITTAALESFGAGLTAFDEARPTGTRGNAVTLVQSGRLRAVAIRFTHDGGTRIRTAIPERYMQVHLGRFRYLPIGAGARLPSKWQRLLGHETADALKEEATPSA